MTEPGATTPTPSAIEATLRGEARAQALYEACGRSMAHPDAVLQAIRSINDAGELRAFCRRVQKALEGRL